MKNTKLIPCSVGILTFNNENTLPKALETVKDFDDIIICDGGSTDSTLNIARSYNATVISQDSTFKLPNNTIRDYSGVRNQTLDIAKNKWFLALDSDEYLSEKIVDEIRSIVQNGDEVPTAYWVPRKYVLNGIIIKCATTYPSRQMRFFHMDVVSHFIKELHERIKVEEDAPVALLKEYMLIPMHDSITTVRKKWRHYAEIEASRPDCINLWSIVKVIYGNVKVSTLFILRYIRNFFFCRGPRIPFAYELERHVYHLQIITAFVNRMLRERTTFRCKKALN